MRHITALSAALTIAALDGSGSASAAHVAESLNYRHQSEQALAA